MRIAAACSVNGISSGARELRDLPSYVMIGAEHEDQHRIAGRVLQDMAAGMPVSRAAIEEFEEASARLSYALYFVRREIECALHSRDATTDAQSSSEVMRDLREWHALARRPAGNAASPSWNSTMYGTALRPKAIPWMSRRSSRP